MPEPIDKLRYACEDEAWALYSAAGPDLFLASIAVSLKRIADGLGKDPMRAIRTIAEKITDDGR